MFEAQRFQFSVEKSHVFAGAEAMTAKYTGFIEYALSVKRITDRFAVDGEFDRGQIVGNGDL